MTPPDKLVTAAVEQFIAALPIDDAETAEVAARRALAAAFAKLPECEEVAVEGGDLFVVGWRSCVEHLAKFGEGT